MIAIWSMDGFLIFKSVAIILNFSFLIKSKLIDLLITSANLSDTSLNVSLTAVMLQSKNLPSTRFLSSSDNFHLPCLILSVAVTSS